MEVELDLDSIERATSQGEQHLEDAANKRSSRYTRTEQNADMIGLLSKNYKQALGEGDKALAKQLAPQINQLGKALSAAIGLAGKPAAGEKKKTLGDRMAELSASDASALYGNQMPAAPDAVPSGAPGRITRRTGSPPPIGGNGSPNKPPKPPKLLKSSAPKKMGGLMGIASSHLVNSAVSSGFGAAGQALTGNVSGAIQGVMGGLQSLGSMFGPAGMAVSAFASVVGSTVKLLDGLVDELGKYSATVSSKMAEYEVATENFKMRMAQETEELMTTWIELKEQSLELLHELMPVIRLLINELTAALKKIQFFTQSSSIGLLGKALGGGSPSGQQAFASANSMMLDDLNMGGGSGATPAQSPGGESSLIEGLHRLIGGRSSKATPNYSTPGGAGVGFNLTQHNAYHVEDAASVDRAVEQVRGRLMMAYMGHIDRVEFAVSMMDARNSVELAL